MLCAAIALGGPDDADAEDLAADAITSLLDGRFDRRNIPPEKVLAYTRAVIRNRAMHEQRHARRLVADDRLLDEQSAGPDSFAMLDERLDVARAMSALAAAQRRVLEQHHLQGMTIAEMAAAARVSEGAVRVRLHRARSALRQVLHEMRSG